MTRLAPAPEGLLRGPTRARPQDNGKPFTVGQRHEAMLNLGGAMRNVGATAAEMEAALLAMNAERCDPPKDEPVVRALAMDIAERYEPDAALTGRFAELHAEIEELRAAVPVKVEAERSRPTSLAILELLVDMEEALRRADEPLPDRIGPLAVDGFLTTVTGIRGSFKSLLMIVLGHCCHDGGREIAGLNCVAGPALHIDAENGPALMGRHFKLLGIPHGGLLIADGSQLRLPRDTGKVEALIDATGARLFTCDSLRTLAPGADEDKSKDMSELVSGLRQVTRNTGAAGVLLHHRSSKPGAPPSRGSSAIEDQSDALFSLTRKSGGRLELKCQGKYRMGIEPSPLWLRMGPLSGGAFGLAACEAAEDDDDDDSPPVTLAEDALVEKINRLVDAVSAEGGWQPQRVAKAVGSDRTSGTYQRAMGLLLERGDWIAKGETSARVLCPTEDFVRECHKTRANSRHP